MARAERRLVSNLATGVQFFRRESNSHYHALKSCIVKTDASFTGPKLVIPLDVKVKLNEYQKLKVYLCTWRCHLKHSTCTFSTEIVNLNDNCIVH